MVYTHAEKTVKKYTVQDAINAAAMRCKGIPICMDRVYRRERAEPITLEELNTLADDIVFDSFYYAS